MRSLLAFIVYGIIFLPILAGIIIMFLTRK